MLALLRVLILIALGSVKLVQPLLVLREMGRHPVHDDADVVLMELIDKVHEVLRCAVTGCGREIAGNLIAPGGVERILGDRHQFDVGVAHLLDIFDQLVRNLAVIEEFAVLILPPRTEIDLIDIDRLADMVLQTALFHPRLVLPRIFSQLIETGSRLRTCLHMICVRIGF